MSDDMDLSEFQDIFFEECRKELTIVEEGLLGLDERCLDADKVNQIFRAAHSIKGGDGTFGFIHISDFSHLVETLFDNNKIGSLYRESINY